MGLLSRLNRAEKKRDAASRAEFKHNAEKFKIEFEALSKKYNVWIRPIMGRYGMSFEFFPMKPQPKPSGLEVADGVVPDSKYEQMRKAVEGEKA